MSFRARLTLFFAVIVVVPMISVTLVLFRLIGDSERGKSDARLQAGRDTAVRLFEAARARGDAGLARVGADPALAAALQQGRAAAATRRANALLGPLGLKRIIVAGPNGLRVDAGGHTAVFPARRPLRAAGGGSFGVLQVSAQGPTSYVQAVKDVTGLDVVLRRGGRTLATTLPAIAGVALPRTTGDVAAGAPKLRAATFPAAGFTGEGDTAVTVLARATATARNVARSREITGAILFGFFVLALALALIVSSNLQRQIAALAAVAQRLGRGDFSARAPEVGRDEFSALGGEFNRMAAELERRLAELRAEQKRTEQAMHRVGESFAANLDRDGVLHLVVEAAADATGATAGRVGGTSDDATTTSTGDPGPFEAVLGEAEAQARVAGTGEIARGDGQAALAHALPGAAAEGGAATVAVARGDRAFTDAERDLFAYLVRQAGVALENVGLHETVERQAITDALTGLANRRHFVDRLGEEVERSRRFGAPATLVLLDIDDFKKVNDTHGHPAGDAVLRAVGGVLSEASREIDVAARIGGEELALLLPGTDRDGALVAAERVRTGVEALRIPLEGGDELRVTASFGTATHPPEGPDAQGLMAAADAALYDAKRTGKNRTIRAGG